tara:strand:- start:8107 stop:8331 length:225 start_codon:yes stop_codon:yes gene_type:complete
MEDTLDVFYHKEKHFLVFRKFRIKISLGKSLADSEHCKPYPFLEQMVKSIEFQVPGVPGIFGNNSGLPKNNIPG